MTDTPKPQKQYKPNGKRLGVKALAAQAFLASGMSVNKTAKACGISPHTAKALAEQELISPEDVERIKKQLEKDEVLKRKMILDSITPDVIKKANLVQRTTSYKHLKSDQSPSIQTQMNVVFNKYDGQNTQSIDVTPQQSTEEN